MPNKKRIISKLPICLLNIVHGTAEAKSFAIFFLFDPRGLLIMYTYSAYPIHVTIICSNQFFACFAILLTVYRLLTIFEIKI